MPKISPFLWFDTQAKDAAEFYVSLFPNSKITRVVLNTGEAPGVKGSVLTVSFELDGQPVGALNGGPYFKLNEAFSFVVHCRDQAEIDHYWDALLDGGSAHACGWLKDKFGLSWQIVPEAFFTMIADADPAKSGRVMAAMMKMIKFDIAKLEDAYAG